MQEYFKSDEGKQAFENWKVEQADKKN